MKYRRKDGGFASTGVLLVALGAAIWGTDTVLRAPLSAAFVPVLLVLGEHLILALYAVPAVFRRWREFLALNPARWGALVIVGWGGSAAAVVLRERLTLLYAPIFAVAIAGAYLLAFGDLEEGLLAPLTGVGQARLGFTLAALGAAALWGTSTAMGRYLGGRLSFATLTGARFLVALPLLLVWAAVTVPDLPGSFAEVLVQPDAARNLVLVALFPGLAGLLLYYRGLRSTPASYATLAELAYPATGIALNWLFLGQPLTVSQGIGVGLVIAAILMMNRARGAVRESPQERARQGRKYLPKEEARHEEHHRWRGRDHGVDGPGGSLFRAGEGLPGCDCRPVGSLPAALPLGVRE